MTTLRVPFALACGFLLSLGVFLGLAQLVGGPLDVGEPVVAQRIVFTPQRREVPPESKRDPKVQRTPPPVVVIHGDPGFTATGVDTTVGVAPPSVTVAPPGGRGLPVGSDRDVLPLVRVSPDYPPRAAAAGIEGWVQVQFTVTASGSVRDALVVASEPGSVFDDAALKAVARWRYNPRVDGGVAVERAGLQTVIRFNLEN
jgi:protein TonB